MTNWNPSATATLGLEWFAFVTGSTSLDALTKIAATSFDQSASVGIGSIQVPNIGIATRGGLYVVEVYDGENAVGDLVPVTNVAVPNEDVTDGTWLNSAGNNVNNYSYIDEGSTPNTSDAIAVAGAQSTYISRFNTGSLTLTGKRILGVKLRCYVATGPTGTFTAGVNLSGTDYTWLAFTPDGTPRWYSSALWAYNPSTKKPWTIADVQAFDTTDEWWIRGGTQPGTLSALALYDCVLEVYTVAETRIALGTLDDTASALTPGTASSPAWNTATVTTPTGGAWTKDGTGRHLYTVRRISGVGAMSIPYLDSLSTPTVGQSWDIALDTTHGFPIGMGSALTRLHPFIQRTTVPADHVDSLPYCMRIDAHVLTGQNAESETSGAAAANYGVLRFLVGKIGSADLLIKVKKRSDNSQLGTTVTLTAAQASAFAVIASGWRLVQVQLGTAATLAAATQYYIEFSSTATGTGYWVLSVPSSNGAGQVGNYNGTSDNATINGAAENTSADVVVTLATVPTAPVSMTAALGSQSVGETVACVTAVPRADLSWATTSLAGLFARYEIQRSSDGGTTWTDIAVVTVESVAAWKDYEGKRGVATSYRIRAVRTDGAFSAWTNAGATVTKPLLAGSGAYASTMFLVSNYDPTQNLAFEYRPSKAYDFPEADEQLRGGAYRRDYMLASNPTENRGVLVKWTFLIGVDDKVPAGGGSWQAWDPLRTLARAVIPYVCALDHRGNRLFCALRVPSGDEDSSGGADVYVAEVQAAQLTATPFVVTVSA